MCGFAGFYNFRADVKSAEQILGQMGERIFRRGPDSWGTWFSNDLDGVGLVHRRLSILELSKEGAQPMFSPSKRYVISFNGEIYNHLNIRTILAKDHHVTWRGNSDTETLLASIELLGLDRTLTLINGMYAFALWDLESRVLYLTRDRLGEKPLYYGFNNSSLLFSSELSSFRAFPGFKGEIDRNALSAYLRRGYVNAPNSIYKDVCKLEPGTTIKFSSGSIIPEFIPYWSPEEHFIAHGDKEKGFHLSPQKTVDSLDSLLSEVVEEQMISDVSLGAFLSGGVDSSTIVALMSKVAKDKINTFSIGFDDPKYNEAEFAKSVAKELSTNHTELYISSKDALEIIPDLSGIYTEPFADSSQIPMYLVSKMAKKSVTVALSGDGGDEIFSGYSRYQKTADLWSNINRVPYCLSGALSSLSRRHKFDFILDMPYFSNNFRGDRILKLLDSISNSSSFYSLYDNLLMSHYRNPDQLVINGREYTPNVPHNKDLDLYESMSLLDMLNYLPGDNLCKVDRASMAVSLETRVPLLDRRVVEFACSIPTNIKRHNNIPKWPLREVLFKYVSRELIERPKKGFSIPLSSWLRGELREWGESLIDPNLLKQQGYLNPVAIKELWDEHQSGKRNWCYVLWNILMFQSWLERQDLV